MQRFFRIPESVSCVLTLSTLVACGADPGSWDEAVGQTQLDVRGGRGGPKGGGSGKGGKVTGKLAGDYGDAPASDNALATPMSAYPGVDAHFPTSAAAAIPGPRHRNSELRFVLGASASQEGGAEQGTDPDSSNNIDPAADVANQDAWDDGLEKPDAIAHCEAQSLQIAVSAFGNATDFPQVAYVNVWADFDRSGAWGEVHTCSAREVASEWAVQNHAITVPGPGTHMVDLPPALMFNDRVGEDMWLRVTLSDTPAGSADGSGPSKGYAYGETEDYKLEAVRPPSTTEPVPELTVVEIPPLPGPTNGFPDEIQTQAGGIKEVDVVYLGGTLGPDSPTVVTAGGTGTQGRLASWSTPNVGAAPVALALSPVLPGENHQLHVLTPPKSPTLAREMLVSGRIQAGTLWLTSWRVADDGSFQLLDSQGYGPNADVDVAHYGMAHRLVESASPDGTGRFQLVTPLFTGDGHLRVVTWEIRDDGEIIGKQDSGDAPAISTPGGDLSVAFVPGRDDVVPAHYTVALEMGTGSMLKSFWEVDDAGMPSLRRQTASEWDIRNTNPSPVPIDSIALAPLSTTGHLAASRQGVSTPSITAVDDANCVDGGCVYQPMAISDDSVDTDPGTPGVQIAQPVINTQRALLRDAAYSTDLFAKAENEVQAIASVRKVMVTIVALEAIENGEVALDDDVVVSAAAANVNNTNASVMGLQAGEVISLENLLYGNMMVSGGDATWAISEHVAGNLQSMLVRMNDKASQLGMASTFHCQEGSTFSSASYSTARDQALLWESVYDDPAFLEFAGKTQRIACGMVGGQQVCHDSVPPLNKTMNQYPNLDGHKTGGGGGLCSAFPEYDGVPTCVSGGCLSIQSNRLGRPLIATELQPSSATGTRFTDAGLLFDYGYQRIFTPDDRSGLTLGSQVEDFALTSASDYYSLVVRAAGDAEITLCNLAVDVSGSSLSKTVCTVLPLTGMSLGSLSQPAPRIDIERVSTLLAEGDYMVGYRTNFDQVMLNLWRVGAK